MESIERALATGRITIRERATSTKSVPSKSTVKDAFNRRQRREVSRLRTLHDTLAERVSTLIQDVDSLKEVSEAAAALDRLGRITDRVVGLERQILGLDTVTDTLGDDFARLLKNAWERAYGTPPPETNQS